MKTLFKNIIAVSVGAVMLSCSDIQFGDTFLGSAPESSGATIDAMFNSVINSDKVLTTAYTYLPYGLPTGGESTNNKLGGNILESLTDIHHSDRNNMSDGPTQLYYNGVLGSMTSGSSMAYRFGTETDYDAIRYAWLYIENAHKIPNMTDKLRAQRVAEAKMIIAISYAEMLRYVGGVPLLKSTIDTNATMNFPRNTFAETVSYIVQLIDEAKPDLPWVHSSTDNGRMSRAAAMALKVRVLGFAASPTFNSDSKWHSDADELTCYGNYDKERWKLAVDAGFEFFDELNRQGYYGLVQPSEETNAARRMAFREGYYNRSSSELLISTRKGYSVSTHDTFLSNVLSSSPTLNYVNMFPWEDGSDFPEDFDWENPPKQPFYRYSEYGLIPTRDPRLYETVAVAGDKVKDGTLAPVYSNNPYYGGGTGFMQMKFVMRESSDRDGLPVQWPYLRLSEVLLSYAEAINEYYEGPNNTAYDCVNKVRSRVGLPELSAGMKQIEFREAVIRERALELGLEEVRWFDLIRWGRETDFTKQLYGLSIVGNDANNPTAFEFKRVPIPRRHWSMKWDTKWYMSPIPNTEVNKDYGIIQNPGW